MILKLYGFNSKECCIRGNQLKDEQEVKSLFSIHVNASIPISIYSLLGGYKCRAWYSHMGMDLEKRLGLDVDIYM